MCRSRHEHPAYFVKIELYMQVMRMPSCYHYRLPARKFLQEVFERVTFTETNLATLDTLEALSPPLSLVSNSVEGIDDDLDAQDGWETAIYSPTSNMSPSNNGVESNNDDSNGGSNGIPPTKRLPQPVKKLPSAVNEKDKNDTRQELPPQMVVRGFGILAS